MLEVKFFKKGNIKEVIKDIDKDLNNIWRKIKDSRHKQKDYLHNKTNQAHKKIQNFRMKK